MIDLESNLTAFYQDPHFDVADAGPQLLAGVRGRGRARRRRRVGGLGVATVAVVATAGLAMYAGSGGSTSQTPNASTPQGVSVNASRILLTAADHVITSPLPPANSYYAITMTEQPANGAAVTAVNVEVIYRPAQNWTDPDRTWRMKFTTPASVHVLAAPCGAFGNPNASPQKLCGDPGSWVNPTPVYLDRISTQSPQQVAQSISDSIPSLQATSAHPRGSALDGAYLALLTAEGNGPATAAIYRGLSILASHDREFTAATTATTWQISTVGQVNNETIVIDRATGRMIGARTHGPAAMGPESITVSVVDAAAVPAPTKRTMR